MTKEIGIDVVFADKIGDLHLIEGYFGWVNLFEKTAEYLVILLVYFGCFATDVLAYGVFTRWVLSVLNELAFGKDIKT